MSEQAVYAANASNADSSLVAVYPSEGSPVLDYPVFRVAAGDGQQQQRDQADQGQPPPPGTREGQGQRRPQQQRRQPAAPPARQGPSEVHGDVLGLQVLGDALGAALAAAGERGAAYVFLEGAPDYYGARGFVPALEHGFLRPSDRIPGPAFQVAVLEDRGLTGRLVYPDAFWRHDAVGLRGEVLARLRQRFGERPDG